MGESSARQLGFGLVPIQPGSVHQKSRAAHRRRLAFLLLLLGSVGLRMIALDRSLVAAHNTRQCQTAILTKNMMAEGGLPLSAHADWMGDEPGRLFYELPLYNWATLGLAHLLGNLDFSGKLVSIALWALAFWLNHRLLQRFLTPNQTHWGDLLFALSPLSIFFGQAFQPEMLIMALALGIVLSFVRHQENGSMGWFWFCVVLSLVAVTVKANEISHLLLLIGMLAFAKEGWPCLLKLRYWIFMGLLAFVGHVYGSYMTEVNSVSFPEWTAVGNLRKFTGNLASRLDWTCYLRTGMYLTILVCTPAAVVAAGWGLWRMCRRQHPRLYLFWTLSLFFFYLVWGPGTSFVHSYYNLPTLPVACGLFGIGASLIVAWLRGSPARRHQLLAPLKRCGSPRKVSAWASGAIAALLALGSAFGSVILFWPDRSAREGGEALRQHICGREGFVLCFPNHASYGPGYAHYATLFHLARVRGWNENPDWTASQRARVHEKCRWVIELRYHPEDQILLRETTLFSNRPHRLLATDSIRLDPSFVQVADTIRYAIWERRPPTSSPVRR